MLRHSIETSKKIRTKRNRRAVHPTKKMHGQVTLLDRPLPPGEGDRAVRLVRASSTLSGLHVGCKWCSGSVQTDPLPQLARSWVFPSRSPESFETVPHGRGLGIARSLPPRQGRHTEGRMRGTRERSFLRSMTCAEVPLTTTD